MLIGLTGQIGSGKSSVAKAFARLGAAVIDADQIGRDVVDGSAPLRRSLVRAFGQSVVGKKGSIRRKALAKLAFVDRSSRDKLNRLVHPYLLAELGRQIRKARKGGRIVVIDAALLLHWEMDRQMDVVVAVQASRRIRLARLRARGITRRDALAREKAQLPFAEYRRRADHVIANNGTRRELEGRACRLFTRITVQTD